MGVLIDSHLNWKVQIQRITKTVPRGIGILFYHAIIMPFLSYSCVVWGNTYDSNIKPLYIYNAKKAIGLITFPNFDAHTSPLFSQLHLLKLHDYIKFLTLYFMHQYIYSQLPKIWFILYKNIQQT